MVSMNIVITGGSGFVGSYLCERLINDGHNLIVVDNLLTGSTENISDLMDKFQDAKLFFEKGIKAYLSKDMELSESFFLIIPIRRIYYIFYNICCFRQKCFFLNGCSKSIIIVIKWSFDFFVIRFYNKIYIF